MAENRQIIDCIYRDDDIEVNYEVHFSYRRTITLQIRAKDKKVVVKLPVGVPLKRAESFVAEKKDWIIKSLNRIDESYKRIPPRDYTTGSKHLLWGDQYTLYVEIGGKNKLKMDGKEWFVTATSDGVVEQILKRWYHKKAIDLIVPIFSDMAYRFGEKYGKAPQKLEFKHVKSFWGVCTSKGVVRVNIDLVRAPKECVEFIIMHELCHLIHLNHSSKFYALLDAEMSDWRERKKLLDSTISSRR